MVRVVKVNNNNHIDIEYEVSLLNEKNIYSSKCIDSNWFICCIYHTLGITPSYHMYI